ncbi:MAG: glycosyltransferase [Gemmatimonadetes bacterium]|nr:glycosyltransferase [Gemmatimonadota bacterium]
MALALGAAGAALLALTWIGYPLAIALVAALRRPAPPAHWPRLPRVTAVLAAREDAAVIEARVRNWLASDYAGPLEVAVAHEPGYPWTPPTDLASRVRVVSGDAPGGKCANLNAGVRAATGEVLVFGDAHQLFVPGAITALVNALGDPQLGAVSGQLEIPRGRAGLVSRAYWAYERRLRRHEALVHSTIGVSGAIYAMRASLWEPLPPGLILDDLHLPMRLVLAGHRVGFEPAAIATETRTVESRQEYRRKVRTLTGNFQLVTWRPALLVPLRNPVWLQFMLHKLARLATPYALLALVVGAAWAGATWYWPPSGKQLAVAGVAALWLSLSPDPVARRLRGVLTQFAALQAATVMALANAVRGRWDIWQPHARRPAP